MLNKDKITDYQLKDKFSKLIEIIQNSKSAVIAYSGGVDSTLLAFVSHSILAQKSKIITVNSDLLPDQELQQAKILAQKYEFNYEIIDIDLINNPKINRNDALRCKYCKEIIFKKLIELARKQDFQEIFDGTNTTDKSDYRPGFEAGLRLGIKSPFIEAEISKQDIKNMAKFFELPNWNKPAQACLASRIPYGTKITKELLKTIEQAETYLKELGYDSFRIRHHDKIARIELSSEDIKAFVSEHREIINSKLKDLGYSYVCLDLKARPL